MSELAEELREYTAMKYAGDCKCGKCQLVPRELVERIYHTLNGAAVSQPEVQSTQLDATEQGYLEDNIRTVAFHLGRPGARMRVDINNEGCLMVDPGEVLGEISRRLDPAQTVREPEIWLLAGRLAGAELNYRNAYEQLGGGHIETGRAWDKLRAAGNAIRAISDSVWDGALSSAEPQPPKTARLMPNRTGEPSYCTTNGADYCHSIIPDARCVECPTLSSTHLGAPHD